MFEEFTFNNRLEDSYTGVGDHHVQCAQLTYSGINHAFDVIFTRDIPKDFQCLALSLRTDHFSSLSQRCFVARDIVHSNVVAVLS